MPSSTKNHLFQSLLAGALALAFSTPVLAVEYEGGALSPVAVVPFGQPVQIGSSVLLSVDYSNVTNFVGQGFANGGAALQGANTITRLVADDITPTGAGAGTDVLTIKFSVANFNATSVSARARVRFWFDNGAGGGPGTYYNVPASVGFSFNPLLFGPGVTVVTGTLGPGLFTMPGARFWAGITFDNNNGATGATLAQMNLLGQGIFDPPTIGSSDDAGFQTTAAGSFFPTDNPAGSLFSLGGAPVTNFGWEFQADATTKARGNTLGEIKTKYR